MTLHHFTRTADLASLFHYETLPVIKYILSLTRHKIIVIPQIF